MSRVFLLSPASCGGRRGRLLLGEGARSDLSQRVRSEAGAPLGEVFAFLSSLYFRGKLTYAEAFADPPAGVPGVLVITPCEGLRRARENVGLERLRRFAEVPIEAANDDYREPLLRDARALAADLGREPACDVVLLGSVASDKYVEPLTGVFGDRLLFPAEFVGRGDMSRGGLMLRCVTDRRELGYVPVAGAVRRGSRPARLAPRPGILKRISAGPVRRSEPAE